MISDAYVRVSCDQRKCREATEIELPFTYGTKRTDGHYDHNDDTVERLLRINEWIVRDGKHFCSARCATNT